VTATATGSATRVAVLITRLDGGAGVLALRGARALDGDGFRVTVVTGAESGLLGAATRAGLAVRVEPALRAPIRPVADLHALTRVTALLRGGGFDVVHTHCAKAGAVGRLAARRAGVPWIVHTYHGFPFHAFQSAARRAAYVAVERRLGSITDVALCVGAGVAADAVRLGLAGPERVRTIGVAVDAATRGPLARQRARQVLGLPADAAVVGAVGRLTYQKAPEDFVAALALLGRPDVVGVWIGGGELARDVAAAVPPGVRLVLPGERADVPELLPAFDVFALPSRYEGLPTAVVEAMVAGVPVVATAVNAVPDVVRPGETGMLVPPGRPETLARAVRYLLDHPATATGMARNAARFVAGRYTESALVSALRHAYAADRTTAFC
jgi:glycosyltransferase involved in cell wall biosynthesis